MSEQWPTFPTCRRTRRKLSDAGRSQSGGPPGPGAVGRPAGRLAGACRGALPRIRGEFPRPAVTIFALPFLPCSPLPFLRSSSSPPPATAAAPGPARARPLTESAGPHRLAPRAPGAGHPPGGTRVPARPRGPSSGGRGRRRRGRGARRRTGPAPPRPTLRPSHPLSRALPPSAAAGSVLWPAGTPEASAAPGPGRLRRSPPRGEAPRRPRAAVSLGFQAGTKAPFRRPGGMVVGARRQLPTPALSRPPRSSSFPPRPSSSPTPRGLTHPAGGEVPPSGQARWEGAAAARGACRAPGPPT